MIEYFHTSGVAKSLQKLDSEEPGCWIALFEPTLEELADIAERFGIDPDDLRAPLDLEEVSRVEAEGGYTMVIADTPIHDVTIGEHGYKTIPIGVYMTAEHVVTVCSFYRIPIISGLKGMRGLHSTADIEGFASDILIASSDAYFLLLRSLETRRAELAEVTTNPSRKELEELFSLDASMVYLTTSLATNDSMFERYRRTMTLSFSGEERDLIDDVIIENRQALEMSRIYSDILDSTIDRFGLIMNSDLNRTMSLVATITLVLCIPTVVGGFFGMNLGGIPLSDSPYGFSIVIGATAIVLAILLVVLKRLRWF